MGNSEVRSNDCVNQITEKIRGFLRESTKHLNNKFDDKKEGVWDRLWAALDAIENTEQSIKEFLAAKPTTLLGINGLLQSLTTQQDAVVHLLDSFKVRVAIWSDQPELQKIRDYRVEATGHPTKIEKFGKQSSYSNSTLVYSSIDRSSISVGHFSYLLYSVVGTERRDVDLNSAITSQRNEICNLLENLLNKLEADESKHKEIFKGQSLKETYELFSEQNMDFYFRAHRAEDVFVESGIKKLREIITRIISGLTKRYGSIGNKLRIPNTELLLDELNGILDHLHELYIARLIGTLDYYIYFDALAKRWSELKDHLVEIDKEFSS